MRASSLLCPRGLLVLAALLASVSSARAQTPAIAAGAFHTCALRQGGTVACWGRGYEGQLGRGPVTQYAGTPGAVQAVGGGGVLTDVTAIAAGSTHTCAVRSDGTAVCWGAGASGQLGDGTVTEDQPTPVAVAEGGAFSVPVGGPPVATDRVRLAIYPTPARTRASATATLALPAAGHARVALYDALGREVALVFDGHAAASQALALDVSGLAPGVYVVRAVAGRATLTRLLVVAR